MLFRTLACLATLSGAWRHRGGGLARSTHMLHFDVLDLDRVLMPEVDQPGVRVLNMRDLGQDLCSGGLQPRVRSLMVYGANPMVSMPNQHRIREGLLREDLFTVVHDLFITDTARYADYVLPATSQIEHLDLSPAWGHLYLALNRPAIAPRGESMCNTELFRRLAQALGRTEPWLFETDESMLRAALASGHPWLDGITYERLWDEGYARLNRPEDWRPFAHGGFATRSGKAELYSDALREPGSIRCRGRARFGRAHGLQLITGEAAALPQLRLQPHGPPSPPRRRAFIRDPSGRRATSWCGHGRPRCGSGTAAGKCARCAWCPTASGPASSGCRSARSRMRWRCAAGGERAHGRGAH